MSINWDGVVAGYQGATEAQRRVTEDERRAKAEGRADQDAAFQEEMRSRQRYDWKEADRVKAQDKETRASIDAEFNARTAAAPMSADMGAATAAVAHDKDMAEVAGAVNGGVRDAGAAAARPMGNAIDGGVPSLLTAPSGTTQVAIKQPQPYAADPTANSPKAAPEVVAKMAELNAAGIPKPRNFTDVLEKQSEFIRRKMANGTMTTEDYAKQSAALSLMQKEGVNDALDKFSIGDYEGGLAAFNNVGKFKAARIVAARPGMTKIGGHGEDVPTHFITLANADGTRTEIDAVNNQYQLMDLHTKMQHQDVAAKNKMQVDQHAATIQVQREQIAQSAKTSAASLALQAKQIQIQQQQYEANTPLGQITALGKARGKALTSDEIENKLGLSKIPRAVELQVQSILKENDTESAAIAKAVAGEGLNPAAMSTFAQNAALRNIKMTKLLAPYSGTGGVAGLAADPLGLNAGGAKTATAASPSAVGGVKTVSNPMATSIGGITAATVSIAPAVGGLQAGPSSAAPSYEGWMAAQRRIDEVQAAARGMSPERAAFYLDARLPELQAQEKFQSGYKKY